MSCAASRGKTRSTSPAGPSWPCGRGSNTSRAKDAEHLASRVCAVGKSDYAGITAVYVAALRANGIPARALCGRVVIFEGQPTSESWPHAKVEFFAQGIGWVPADVAGAIRSNRSPDGLEFFGNDSAEFLTMHLDTDLVIDTYTGRKTVEWLPEASVYVLGAGTFDGGQTKATVTVEVEPLDLTAVLAQARPPRRQEAGRETASVGAVERPGSSEKSRVRPDPPALSRPRPLSIRARGGRWPSCRQNRPAAPGVERPRGS